jgi:coenzyme F420-reducing hydrogenase delta subunit
MYGNQLSTSLGILMAVSVQVVVLRLLPLEEAAFWWETMQGVLIFGELEQEKCHFERGNFRRKIT